MNEDTPTKTPKVLEGKAAKAGDTKPLGTTRETGELPKGHTRPEVEVEAPLPCLLSPVHLGGEPMCVAWHRRRPNWDV